MAFEVNTVHNGLPVPTGYERVEYVGHSMKNKTVVVEMALFADAASARRVDEAGTTKEPELARRSVTIRNVPAVMRPDTDENDQPIEVEVSPAYNDYDDWKARVVTDNDQKAAYGTLRAMGTRVAAKATKSTEERMLAPFATAKDV